MNKPLIQRRTGAILLAFLFTAAWSLRVAHGLFTHHKHHEHPVCAMAADHAGKQHFHDDHYAPENECPLCAFWFSIPELQIVAMSLRPLALTSSDTAIPVVQMPGFRQASTSIRLRGPPKC